MKFLIASLIFFVGLQEVWSSNMIIKFVKFKKNTTIYANSYQEFRNLDDGDVLMNSTVEFFQDVLKEVQFLVIKASKDDKDVNYDIPILQTRIETCRLSEGVLNSIFVKIVMENFNNSSDYDHKCPMKMGIKKMTDLRISSKHFPPFPKLIFPSGQIAFHIKDNLFGKIKGQKRMVRLYTWELFLKVYEKKIP